MALAKWYLPCAAAIVLLAVAGMLKVWSRVDEHGASVAFRPRPLPAQLAGWTYARPLNLSPETHSLLSDDASWWGAYRRGSYSADVLILYGHRKRTFHLPESCLVGVGNVITYRQGITLTTPGSRVAARFQALVLDKEHAGKLTLYAFVGPDGKPTDLIGLNTDMLWCRARGRSPRGAVLRVMGTIVPGKSMASQPLCGLAAAALEEAMLTVTDAGSSGPAGRRARSVRSDRSGARLSL